MKKNKHYSEKRLEKARQRRKLKIQRFLIIATEVTILLCLIAVAYNL